MRRSRPSEPPDPARLRDTAARILSARAHSVEQLRRKLLRRGFSEDDVARELEWLCERRFLDDPSWARQTAGSRLRARYGRKRVEWELDAAGVTEDVRRQALEHALREEDEGARMEEALERRLRILVRRHGNTFMKSREGRTKLASHLLQRGYEPADIIRAVDQATDRLPRQHDTPTIGGSIRSETDQYHDDDHE